MKKKGVIEIQFNWIFTLIIGALILALFASIVFKQKSSSETSACATTLTYLETILVGAKISTGTLNIIDIPKTDIKFSCDQYSQCNIQKRIRDKVIFSSNIIKGNKIITWAMEWKLPFKVTNFLYLSSPLIRYILIGDDETFKLINITIPKEINKEYYSFDDYDPNSFKDLNNYKIKIVFFNPPSGSSIVAPQIFGKMGDDLTVLKVEGDNEVGKIYFYRNKNGLIPDGESSYLKKEALLGAIFIEDRENYDCTMQKAFNNLKIVSDIYLKKSEKTKLDFDASSSCYVYYDNSNLEGINTNSDQFTYDSSNTINEASHIVESQNRKLQLSSCPLIY